MVILSPLPRNTVDLTFVASEFTPDELEEIERFNEIADKMYIPFDEERQYHPQFDGFDPESERPN